MFKKGNSLVVLTMMMSSVLLLFCHLVPRQHAALSRLHPHKLLGKLVVVSCREDVEDGLSHVRHDVAAAEAEREVDLVVEGGARDDGDPYHLVLPEGGVVFGSEEKLGGFPVGEGATS